MIIVSVGIVYLVGMLCYALSYINFFEPLREMLQTVISNLFAGVESYTRFTLAYILAMALLLTVSFLVPYILVSLRQRRERRKGILSFAGVALLLALIYSTYSFYESFMLVDVILCFLAPVYSIWSHLEYGKLRLNYRDNSQKAQKRKGREKNTTESGPWEFQRAKIVYPDAKKKMTFWQAFREYGYPMIAFLIIWKAADWGFLAMIGAAVVLLTVAVVYIIKNPVPPADYIQISLPSYWPADCQHEGYATGLSEKKKGKKKKDHALDFYETCRKNGIYFLSEPEKLRKIAKQKGYKDLSDEYICSLYQRGEKLAKANEAIDHTAQTGSQLRELRIQELKQLVAAMEYYGESGTMKRYRMLQDKEAEFRQKARTARETVGDIPSMFMQRESSSSIAGGIAHGIGGLGAGLLVASDVERKNAEIRKQNKANAPLAISAMGVMRDAAEEYDKRADYYSQKSRDALKAKIWEYSDQKAFQQLKIGNVQTAVSKTGAVTVRAEFSQKDTDKNTVVDGTVAARLYQDGILEASAYFVLPVEGISCKQVQLTAISTKPVDPAATYTVEFEPIDLMILDSMH